MANESLRTKMVKAGQPAQPDTGNEIYSVMDCQFMPTAPAKKAAQPLLPKNALVTSEANGRSRIQSDIAQEMPWLFDCER